MKVFLAGFSGGGKKGRERERQARLPFCRTLREVRGMRGGWMEMADTKLWLVPREILQKPKVETAREGS